MSNLQDALYVPVVWNNFVNDKTFFRHKPLTNNKKRIIK